MDEAEEDYPEPPVATDAIDPAALQARIDAGESVRLLDVRDRDEIDRWRIEGASVTTTAIPYARVLQAQVTEGVADLADSIEGDGPITVVCGRGEASDYVAGLLSAADVPARNLAGGMQAWARVLERVTVDAGSVTLHQYRRPSSGCLSYVVAADGEAMVVDPLRAFADRYLDDARGRGETVVAVLDTHVHADHLSGVRAVSEGAGIPPMLPAPALARGVAFEAEAIRPGAELQVGDAAVETVALPGHTTDMTGLVAGDALLTGDSVFVDGVARPDLQEDVSPVEMAADLHETLTDRLAGFPGETVVAPGHHQPTSPVAADGSVTASLATVRERVPGFDQPREVFVERVLGGDPPAPANAGRIVAVNLGRESIDGDAAFELELGPNNCAAAPTAE